MNNKIKYKNFYGSHMKNALLNMGSLNFYYIVLIFMCSSGIALSQSIRSLSMGGMTLAINDKENSLTPFYFAGNPAWLNQAENDTWLKIIPSVTNNWGSYKKRYTAQSSSLYGLGFEGVKTLGDKGTFLGTTNYTYEYRKEVYRTLEYNPYAGESFFFLDTTTGNVRYSGPKVEFMYSWELLPNLYAGASAKYQILNGLKKQYSYAETTLREFGIDIGLAYKVLDNLVLGINFKLNDIQEKITSADVNQMDVEIFYFRGETYSIYKRSSSIEEKLRTKGNTFSSQLYWKPNEFSEIGVAGEYSNSNMKILVPFSISTNNSSNSYDEYQDGYSTFDHYNIKMNGRYELLPYLIAGVSINHSKNNSWSEYSPKNLLLWEWNVKATTIGAGLSYNITNSLLGGIEYSFSKLNADSSKYIDSRFSNINSNDNLIKVGFDYSLFENLFLRAGYNYGKLGNDLIGGGKNVSYNVVTAGAGIKISNITNIDLLIGYSSYKPENLNNNVRNNLSGQVILTLYNF